ncbi:Ig-like domain-containing protein, partial [Staphylococcus haemolyticus]|nr:YSIRK signal domain/LPXTG anchor domain surface protein [Staphylococcus haemolyticus]
VKATDTTPPTVPTLDTDLVGKAGTQTPITVTTDPNTHVDLLDKDGNIIGSGTTDNTGHVTITPTKPIPEGNVTAKATDNAEHPNSSVSKPVKATKPIVKSGKKAKHYKTKISKNHNSKEYGNHNSNKPKNTIHGEKKNITNIGGISKNKVKDLPNTGIKETSNNSLPYLVTLLGSFVLLIGRRKDNNRNK